jgi:hypothetical protein
MGADNIFVEKREEKLIEFLYVTSDLFVACVLVTMLYKIVKPPCCHCMPVVLFILECWGLKRNSPPFLRIVCFAFGA